MNTFSHLIYYVKNVDETLTFFEKAFGFERSFLHESGMYGELATGSTALAFASEEMAQMNLPDGYTPTQLKNPPFACEVAFTTDDVQKSFDQAITTGATKIAEPKEKPWGQTVGYVRDPNGILIEIASKMS